MALPLAMLKRLQMRMPLKIGLAGIFCLAFITIGFDILRAVETETKGGVKGSTALWTNLESAVAVVVSCLPSFTALFSPKNKRNNGRKYVPYKQRSLAISDTAKLCMSARGSVGSGFSGHASAVEELDKCLVTSNSSMFVPVADGPQCKDGSIV